MKLKSALAALALTAAAAIAPLSVAPAQAAPTPLSEQPCAKSVGDWNVSGHNGIKVADVKGTIHWIYKGSPQTFCPWQVYVPSGYDVYASQSNGTNSTYTSTGWHTFKSSLLVVNYRLNLWQH
jgi:hypothetical protein